MRVVACDDELPYEPGRKTIAVDFDGVIHAYSRGWEDGVIYDDPVPDTALALCGLHEYYRVVVFTARTDLQPVADWLERHGLASYVTGVTNSKPKAWAYVDDRAIRFNQEEGWLAALTTIADLAPGDSWHAYDPRG